MTHTKSLYFPIVAVFVFILSGVLWINHGHTSNEEEIRIYIPTGSTYEAVVDTLMANHCLDSRSTFDRKAHMRKYPSSVKPGSYIIHPNMSCYRLVRKLRSGSQDPIIVVIGKQRSLETLCNNLDKRFEFSGRQLYRMLNSDSVCHHYGLTRSTIMTLFVRNSYEYYWNVTPSRFLDRMQQEHSRYWNSSRLSKCDALKLTPAEVTILASIIEEETNVDDEKPLIASVYLNRIRRRMPLQADPTVRYAVGDFSIRRILKSHTEIPSPYNTYQHIGLPPGPICIPGTASIDAVLANHRTSYLYFCAKEDFSGRHNFAATLAEHQQNANRFHNALNKRKIYK
ncbi:MAG: endolytic transglycosylase MltG [Bacteroidales bacterium]|nr:endolytic transglycosylase MltG [Bacteroidales bacterium]